MVGWLHRDPPQLAADLENHINSDDMFVEDGAEDSHDEAMHFAEYLPGTRRRMMANDMAKGILSIRKKEGKVISEEDILGVLRVWDFKRNTGRPNVQPDSSAFIFSETLGLVHDRRGRTVAGNPTLGYPHVAHLLNRFLVERLPNQMAGFKFSSVTINKDFASRRHRDRNNAGPSIVHAFGNFQGGELGYFPYDDGRKEVEGLCDEEMTCLDARKNFIFFDGRRAHQVQGFSGERYSAVWYLCSRAQGAGAQTRARLRSCGFNLPTPGEREPPPVGPTAQGEEFAVWPVEACDSGSSPLHAFEEIFPDGGADFPQYRSNPWGREVAMINPSFGATSTTRLWGLVEGIQPCDDVDACFDGLSVSCTPSGGQAE